MGMKPRAPLRGDERAEVRGVAAGDEDHGRARRVGRDARGDVEAVDVGEVDVEQHEVGAAARQASAIAAGAVRRLADDVVALRLQEHASGRPEGRVVVDDEDGGGH